MVTDTERKDFIELAQKMLNVLSEYVMEASKDPTRNLNRARAVALTAVDTVLGASYSALGGEVTLISPYPGMVAREAKLVTMELPENYEATVLAIWEAEHGAPVHNRTLD